jgi:hypothetical protein
MPRYLAPLCGSEEQHDHPTIATIEAMVQHRLSISARVRVSNHLEYCTECVATSRKLLAALNDLEKGDSHVAVV